MKRRKFLGGLLATSAAIIAVPTLLAGGKIKPKATVASNEEFLKEITTKKGNIYIKLYNNSALSEIENLKEVSYTNYKAVEIPRDSKHWRIEYDDEDDEDSLSRVYNNKEIRFPECGEESDIVRSFGIVTSRGSVLYVCDLQLGEDGLLVTEGIQPMIIKDQLEISEEMRLIE